MATLAATTNDNGKSSTSPEIEKLVANLERRPLPVGTLARLWTIGGLQVELTADYLTNWIKGLFADRETRERQMAETHLAAAIKVLGNMAYLRGLATKLGQALANFPSIVPSQVAEVLGQLNFQAPPMHFSLVRELFVNELGGEPEELFAEFDRKAFAAASLGQLHRARLHTGEIVAVKIQYPGIASTMKTDFRNLKALLLPIRFSTHWQVLRLTLEDMLKVLMDETDYRKEAAYQKRAAELLQGMDGIRVPKIFDEFSTERVLTSEFIEGVHLDAYLAQSPQQEDKNSFAEKIARSTARLTHAGRLLYADPNPGNFLFCPDGSLGLLDFGAMRPINEQEFDFLLRSEQVLFYDYSDEEALIKIGHESTGMPESYELSDMKKRLMARWGTWFGSPYYENKPFHYSHDHWKEGVDLLVKSIATGGGAFTGQMAHQCRLVLGGIAIFCRLDARMNAQQIQKDEVAYCKAIRHGSA